MDFDFNCPHCGHKHVVGTTHFGKTGQCRKCKKHFTIGNVDTRVESTTIGQQSNVPKKNLTRILLVALILSVLGNTILGTALFIKTTLPLQTEKTLIRETIQTPPLQSIGNDRQEAINFDPSSPESVLSKYLQASFWEDRLPLIVNPEQEKETMSLYYSQSYYPITNFKIETASAQTSKDNQVILAVSFPDRRNFKYSLVKIGNEYKVDWRRSVLSEFSIENPVIRIKLLKRSGNYSNTTFDFEVSNESGAFVAYYGLEVSFFDKSGQYLGKSITGGQNLKSRESRIDQALLIDVKSELVADWKPTLSNLTVESPSGGQLPNALRFFRLELAD